MGTPPEHDETLIMSLVNLRQAINYTNKSGGSLGAFNVSCWEMAPAIVEAAEKASFPVVLQSQWPFLEHVGVTKATRFLVDLAEEASIPIVLQLDHAREWDDATK